MDREKVNFAWWYYFWLLAAVEVLSLFFHEGWTDWLFWALSLVGLAGLWGYLRRQALWHRYFWAIYLGLAFSSVLYSAASVISAASEWRLALSAVFVLTTALAFPLLLALWRYSFRSPHIWRQAASAA